MEQTTTFTVEGFTSQAGAEEYQTKILNLLPVLPDTMAARLRKTDNDGAGGVNGVYHNKKVRERQKIQDALDAGSSQGFTAA